MRVLSDLLVFLDVPYPEPAAARPTPKDGGRLPSFETV